MKRYIILFFALLPFLFSCEKYQTYGTLAIDVKTDIQREFRIDIYPHHNDELNYYHPVYSREFNTKSVSDNIILSPGNYIVDVFGGPAKGVNIIAGRETKLLIDLSK